MGTFGAQPTEGDLLKAPFVQLFKLSDDPHEDHNLSAAHPERVEEMVKLLQAQVANGRSTPGPALENDKNVRIVTLKDARLPDVVRGE